LDREYAEAIGVDVDALYIMNMVPNPEKLPLAAEDILTEIEILASTGEFGLIALDSVTGLSPRRELESELEEENPGLQARVVTKACRRLAPILKSNECGLLVADQQRANFKARGWGASPTKAAMANAIKHYAKLIVRISRGAVEKDGSTPIGIKAYGYCMKNQGGIPYHTAEFYITHGMGIDWAREMVDLGKEHGVIEQRGSWYYLMSVDPETGEVTEEQLAQGQENSAQVIRESGSIAREIRQKIVERIESD
jgi:recombination protein RecA